MKLFSLISFWLPEDGVPIMLHYTFDLSSFGWLTKYTVKNQLSKGSKELILLSDEFLKMNATYGGVKFNAYVGKRNSFGCVLITDEDYPGLPAYELIDKAISNIKDNCKDMQLSKLVSDTWVNAPDIATDFKKYQNPLSIEQNLEETKDILIGTVQKIMDNVETVQDLSEYQIITNKWNGGRSYIPRRPSFRMSNKWCSYL